MLVERFEAMAAITLLLGGISLWLALNKKTWKHAPTVGRTNNLVYGIANVLFFVYASKILLEAGTWERTRRWEEEQKKEGKMAWEDEEKGTYKLRRREEKTKYTMCEENKIKEMG
jgi:hypothetical protein